MPTGTSKGYKTNSKTNKLKRELRKWQALSNLSKNKDYQQFLKPILREAFSNLWPDPSRAHSFEEFFKQYSEQYGRAIAYKEIYNMLESAETMVVNLSEQIKKPKKDYVIG